MLTSVRAKRGAAPVLVLAALALAGCTVSPLYVPRPGTATSVATTLAAISIPPATERLGQVVRNELMFHFNNGAAPATPLYELSLTASVANAGFGVGTGQIATVTVRYTLAEIATGRRLATGQAAASAEFEQVSNQAFANLSARENAAERAAAAAAREVWIDLSAEIAAGFPG